MPHFGYRSMTGMIKMKLPFDSVAERSRSAGCRVLSIPHFYITPSELVEVSAAVPERRNIIGRGVTPDKNVNTIQNPDGVK